VRPFPRAPGVLITVLLAAGFVGALCLIGAASCASVPVVPTAPLIECYDDVKRPVTCCLVRGEDATKPPALSCVPRQ